MLEVIAAGDWKSEEVRRGCALGGLPKGGEVIWSGSGVPSGEVGGEESERSEERSLRGAMAFEEVLRTYVAVRGGLRRLGVRCGCAARCAPRGDG